MANSTRMKWPYPSEGADPWYESFDNMVRAIDSSVYGSKEFANLIVTGGGNFTWNASTNVLSWTEDIRIYSSQTGFYEKVLAGSVSVPSTDGAIGYVLYTQQPLSNPTLPLYVASQLPVSEPDRSLLLFRRRGTKVYFRNGFAIQDGETLQIFEGGAAVVLTLSGDVTGPSTNTTVTKLLNIALSTAPLSAGQAYVYNGTLLAPTDIPTVSSLWSLTGNAGTTPISVSGGTNYIGTSDAVALDLATNGIQRLTIGSTGNLLIPLASGASFTLGGAGAGNVSVQPAGTGDITLGHAAGGSVTILAGTTAASKKITINHASGATELYGSFTGSGAFSVNTGTEAVAVSLGNRSNGLAVSLKSSSLIDLDSAASIALNGATAVNINTSTAVGAAGDTNIGVSGKTVTLTGTYNLASLTPPAASKFSPLRIDSNRAVSNAALSLNEATEITGWNSVTAATVVSLKSTGSFTLQSSATGSIFLLGADSNTSTGATNAVIAGGKNTNIGSGGNAYVDGGYADIGLSSSGTVYIGTRETTPYRTSAVQIGRAGITTTINGTLALGVALPIGSGGTGAATTSERYVFIGPDSTTSPPATGAPSFRALVEGDIPTLSATKISGIPYDFSGEVPGLPGTDVELYHFKAVRPFKLAAALSATDVHQAGAVGLPSALTTFNIYKDTVLSPTIGSFTISSTGVATFTVAETDFAKGNVVIVKTTAAVNNIIQPYFTFVGTLI